MVAPIERPHHAVSGRNARGHSFTKEKARAKSIRDWLDAAEPAEGAPSATH
jgi:hypothetical protein